MARLPQLSGREVISALQREGFVVDRITGSHPQLELNALLSGRDGFGELSPEIIYLQYPTATCCICGKDDLSRWGVPIDVETALICANDYEGDWAAKPACRECWAKHDAGQFVGHDPAF